MDEATIKVDTLYVAAVLLPDGWHTVDDEATFDLGPV